MFSEDRLPYNQHGELLAKDNVIKTLNPKDKPYLHIHLESTFSNYDIVASIHKCKFICKLSKNHFKHDYGFITISIPF